MLKTVLAGIFLFAFTGFAVAGETVQVTSQVVLNGTVASLKAPSEQGPVAQVKPGEELTITGVCVADASSAEGLRVMLTLASEAGADAGYHVLATEQALGTEGLNVRVPDLPETANRDFNVRVFVLDNDSPQICNAGTIHVGGPGKNNLG
jgi:hypothetical protein